MNKFKIWCFDLRQGKEESNIWFKIFNYEIFRSVKKFLIKIIKTQIVYQNSLLKKNFKN